MIMQFYNQIIAAYIENPIAQICGFIGLAVILFGYAQKDDKKYITIISISLFFWAIHFYLLEIYAATAASVIGIIRLYLSLKFKNNFKIFLFIVVTICFFGVLTYQNIYSLLTISASLFGAYGYFYLEKIALRSLMFFCSFLWLINNNIVGSIPGVINEVLIQIVLLITIYRLTTFEGKALYYRDKIKHIIHWKKKPDLGRFDTIHYIKK